MKARCIKFTALSIVLVCCFNFVVASMHNEITNIKLENTPERTKLILKFNAPYKI